MASVESLKQELRKEREKTAQRLRGWMHWLAEPDRPHVSDADRTTAVKTLRDLADAIDIRSGAHVADGWIEIALLCAAEDTIRTGGLAK